jgi:hypothetical protein
MGVAEGRFIAINANAWLRQRWEQGDVWSKSYQLHWSYRTIINTARVASTHVGNPIDGTTQASP